MMKASQALSEDVEARALPPKVQEPSPETVDANRGP